MAPSAAERRSPLLPELFARLTDFDPARAEYALRLTAIVAVTVLVTETYQTIDPALSAYIPFVTIKPDRLSSILTATVLIALATVALIVLTPFAGALDDDPGLRLAVMGCVSLGFMFLSSASRLGPQAAMAAMILVYVFALMPMVPIGEITTRGFLHAWLMAAIPLGATIVGNMLIGPAPRRIAEARLAEGLRAAAEALHGAPERRARLDAALRANAAEVPRLLRLAAIERTSPPQDLAALRQASLATFRILAVAAAILGDRKARPPEPIAAALAALFCEMADIFDEGCYPTEIAFAFDREAEGVPNAPARTALEEIEAALEAFPSRDPKTALPPRSAEPGEGFFRSDAFSNPIHTLFAAKSTLAALSCYWLYTGLSWPGIHTCLITCYLVAERSAAESLQKANLRIAGCLIGSAVGLSVILFAFPLMTSIGSLLLVVGAVTFVAGWIAAGGERIAYCGFQLAFAFYIGVLQGYGPGFDMVQIRDRILGMFLGIAVGYVTYGFLWPRSIADRIEAEFRKLLQSFADMARAPDRLGRTASAVAAQGLLDSVGRDLVTIAYEPDSARPEAVWLKIHRRTADDLARLFGPLFLRPIGDPAASGLGDRLAESAAIAAGGSLAAEPGAEHGLAGLGGATARRWKRLDRALRRMQAMQTSQSDA